MELPLGLLEKLMGCSELKEKLWKLLAKLELKLKAALKVIREKIKSFDIRQTCLSKIKEYIKNMNYWIQGLLGVSGVVCVITGALLCLEEAELAAMITFASR